MKGFIIVLCILAIIYFIVAKAVNEGIKKYNLTHSGTDRWGNSLSKPLLPDSLAFLIAPIIVWVGLMFVVAVPAQECGVVVTPSGVKQESYKTGWHFVMPWYKVERMDKTVQVYTCANLGSNGTVDADDSRMTEAKKSSVQGTTIWAPTIDGIKMGFAVSASWRIDPEYAWWIYDNVSELDGENNGRFYWLEENVIKAKLKSALALTASKYTPIEVYSNKREEIQQLTFEKMEAAVKSYHLVLENIDIREVYYNTEYENAINRKKLEEQQALTLVEITKQKEELKKQALIQKDIDITVAEAEAQALKIKGQSISSNPKIVELQWIEKWNGQLPTYMLGSGQGIMLNLNQ